MESIKSALLETFKKNVEGLKKERSRFAYGITISSFHPFKSEKFLAEGITFQPVGKINIDVPLLVSKSLEILRKTTEFLFDISIQEEIGLLNGDFYGYCYFKDEGSSKKKGKISFELKHLKKDSHKDCFIIELPESKFDFKDTRPIYKRSLRTSLKKEESSAWVHNPHISESYDFEEEFSLVKPHPQKPDIALGVNDLAMIEDIDLEHRVFLPEHGSLDTSLGVESFGTIEAIDESISEISQNKSPDLRVKVLQEFKINKYITLKLLDNTILGKSTRIFVDNNPFLQCMYIMLNNPQENPLQSEIDSIDEAAEKLDSRLELFLSPPSPISPESMFWAHSSNLQAWYELGYDSRILHSNLSFPLLKKLADVGDPKAKKVFKEEIAKRILDQYLPVTIYLLKERYLDYLDDSEIEYIFHELSEQVMTPNSEFRDERFAGILLKIGTSYLKKGLYIGHLIIDLCIKLRNLLNNHPYKLK